MWGEGGEGVEGEGMDERGDYAQSVWWENEVRIKCCESNVMKCEWSETELIKVLKGDEISGYVWTRCKDVVWWCGIWVIMLVFSFLIL